MFQFRSPSIAWGLTLLFFAVSCASDDAAQSGASSADDPTAEEAPSPASAGPGKAKPPSGDLIRPKFAWPAPGNVRYKRITEEETRNGDGPAVKETTSILYTLQVQARKGGGRAIRYTDPRELKMDGVTDEEAAELAPLLGAMVPDLLLDANGRVEALRGTDRVREAMTTLYGSDPAQLKQILAYATDEQLLHSARGEFDPLAALWSGRDLPLGRKFVGKVKEVHPLLGVPVDMKIEFGAVKRMACPGPTQAGASTASEDCVMYRLVRTPEPESLSVGIEQWLKNMGAPGDAVAHRVETTATSTLLADGRTLQPYMYTLEKKTVLDMTDKGERTTTHKTEKRTELFKFLPGESAGP